LLVMAAAAWIWRDDLRGMFRRWSRPARAPIIALAPFQLSGAERSRVYFADGFTEDVATRLGQIPGLTVLGRMSTRANHAVAPEVVGKQAGAPLVLTGTIRADGAGLVVTARVIDTATRGEAWSGVFRADLKNVCGLQAEIAEAVARDLGIRLAPSAARDRMALRSVDPNAYDLYLQGREAVGRADLDRAVALLDQAVSVDGSLAEAQALLARALALQRDITGEVDEALEARIAQASGAALAADPDLPDAQVAMGLAENGQEAALGYFRHAVELDPSFALGYHEIADEIVGIDTQRATAFYQKSLDLDPLLDINYRDRANAFALLDQFEASLRDIGKGQAINPSGWWWRGMIARVQFDQRHFADGIGLAAGDPAMTRSVPLLVAYAVALQMDGRQGEAATAVSAFHSRHPNSCQPAALVAAFDYDAGRQREAAAQASRLIHTAEAPAAAVSTYSCAAMASAAIDDAAGVSFWLRRIAASDEATRQWVRDTNGNGPYAALRRQWYPWNKVVGDKAVASAALEVESARARIRAKIAVALNGVLTARPSADE
jgi:TolB-like protein